MHSKYNWAEATAAGFEPRLRQGHTDKGQIYTAKVGAILKLAAYAPLCICTILIIIWIHNVLHSASGFELYSMGRIATNDQPVSK